MMLMWICLLIGTTTCIPVKNAFSSGLAAPARANMPLSAPASSWDSGSTGVSVLGSSSSLPGSAGGYVSFGAGANSNPEAGEFGAYAAYGYGSSAPESSSYGSDTGADEEASSFGASAPGYESWSSGSAAGSDAGSEEPQQVFSDVSDLEPVYAFSSRSSYQRGRAVFAQTRYTPGEPVVPPMPIYRPIIKIPVQPVAPVEQSPPVKSPTKGGY